MSDIYSVAFYPYSGGTFRMAHLVWLVLLKGVVLAKGGLFFIFDML